MISTMSQSHPLSFMSLGLLPPYPSPGCSASSVVLGCFVFLAVDRTCFTRWVAADFPFFPVTKILWQFHFFFTIICLTLYLYSYLAPLQQVVCFLADNALKPLMQTAEKPISESVVWATRSWITLRRVLNRKSIKRITVKRSGVLESPSCIGGSEGSKTRPIQPPQHSDAAVYV